MQRLLFIGPLPPPTTGQSLANEAALLGFRRFSATTVIDFTRNNALDQSHRFWGGIATFGKVFWKTVTAGRRFDAVYFTITQSRLGNLRDLAILWLLGRRLRRRTTIHLHGGHFDELIASMPSWQRKLNNYLYGQVRRGIVLGPSLSRCLLPVIPRSRIIAIPNPVGPGAFVSQATLREKWREPSPLKILYLSNFLAEKGFQELIEGFIRYVSKRPYGAELHLAGHCPSVAVEQALRDVASQHNSIAFHGPVTGDAKYSLLRACHLFALPTYYRYEGQPIALLEAYAAGLCVLTTQQGGIADIFTDSVNGFEIPPRAPSAIAAALERASADVASCARIAAHNRTYAEGFTESLFTSALASALDASQDGTDR